MSSSDRLRVAVIGTGFIGGVHVRSARLAGAEVVGVAASTPQRSEAEAKRLIEAQCVLPAYEMVMKCSHTFNLLDAHGAISVTERAAYIGRVRALARAIAQAYYESRARLGFPMLKRPPEAEAA